MRDWRIADKEINWLNVAIVGIFGRWKGPYMLWFMLQRDFGESK